MHVSSMQEFFLVNTSNQLEVNSENSKSQKPSNPINGFTKSGTTLNLANLLKLICYLINCSKKFNMPKQNHLRKK